MDEADHLVLGRAVKSSVKVACPLCKRERTVNRLSYAGAAAREGIVQARVLVCQTCKLLQSVEDHKAAIAKLYRQILDRRMRGL